MKLKSFLLYFSLFVNVLFISLFVAASFSKNSSIYYHSTGDGYTVAAAVAAFPDDSECVFDQLYFSLKPGDKAFLQFSVITLNNQGNILINPLYDPEIISVTHTGYGLEITALSEGETLMQTFSNDGIKNVALITVAK